MAGVLQLLVLFATSLWWADAFQNSTNTTVHAPETLSYPSQVPTDGTTVEPVPYACPARFTKRHSCETRCDTPAVSPAHYCHCDPLCAKYGDCCPDYADICGGETDEETNIGEQQRDGGGQGKVFGESETNVSVSPTFAESAVTMTWEDAMTTKPSDVEADDSPQEDDFVRCVQTTSFDPHGHQPRVGHRMVALCPQTWSGDPGIRALCEGSAASDGLLSIPVEGTDDRNYGNIYCALCHGLRPDSVTFWSVSYQEKEFGQLRFLNASQMLHMAKETGPNQAFTKFLYPPGFIKNRGSSALRSCVVLDEIPCSVGDADIQDACLRHFAPIALNGTTYRNLECLLLCENLSGSTIPLREWCKSLNGPGGRTNFLSMATLLIFSDRTDLSGPNEDLATEGALCGQNQIYDPFLALCRDLTCPSGFFLSDGVRCVRVSQTDSSTLDQMARFTTTLSVSGGFKDEYDIQNTGSTKTPSDESWEAVARKVADDFLSFVSPCGNREIGGNWKVKNDDHLCDDVIVTWACSEGAAILKSTGWCTTRNAFTCSVNVSLNSEAPPHDQLMNGNRALLGECFQGSFWNCTIQLDYFTVSTPCKLLSNKTSGSMNDSTGDFAPTATVAFTWDDQFGLFLELENTFDDSCREGILDCPLLTFLKEDYVMAGALNDSIRLTRYDRVLQKGEFNLKDNGDVEVCNFLLEETPTATPSNRMWSYAHSVLTVAGSSLSLLGLVITLVTYVAFPTLRRNAAGKSLMSLAVSLFLAQLTMLIGLERTDVIVFCVTFAISSHFFWLAAFFWMNILAIDIYRTFGIWTKLNDPNTRSFLYYALYGWCAPLIIVCTCVFLSFCDCVEVDVHYRSETACWIGNGTANLLAFGLPIVVILCSNAVLFSLTVAGVTMTRRASERMNITQGQSNSAAKPCTDLILYMKLTAVMGFTWVFGFVASITGVEFFWYPFIVLNSLQGALVCLAFVGNRRVVAMWRVKVKGSGGRQLSKTDTSSTKRLQDTHQTSMSEHSRTDQSTKSTQM